ncbi:hypothetical protein R3P38DRAFT_3374358, partial [Favolaschia claudopus]
MYRLGYTPSQLRMAGLDKTLGMLLIGAFVSAALYGVGCLQAWHYYQKFKGDSAWLKALVAFVIVIDTCQQALVAGPHSASRLKDLTGTKHFDNQGVFRSFYSPGRSAVSATSLSSCEPVIVCGKRTLDIISVSSFLNPARTALVIVGAFATEIVFALKAMTTETFAELE